MDERGSRHCFWPAPRAMSSFRKYISDSILFYDRSRISLRENLNLDALAMMGWNGWFGGSPINNAMVDHVLRVRTAMTKKSLRERRL
jgi:hypothetical protein